MVRLPPYLQMKESENTVLFPRSAVRREIQPERCIYVALKTITAFTDHRGSLHPPVPAEELAAWLGFQIIPLFTPSDEFSGLVSAREKLIGINGRHHRHRQRFSLCHELGHILLMHPPEARCNARQIAYYNTEADECAAELLMPGSLLGRWINTTRNVGELARIFDVSKEAMALKVKQWNSEMAHAQDPQG